jgi:uncharacterized SAM-binding protein YcdF (DUF218 family)
MLLGVLIPAAVWALWRAEPGSNTKREHFDVILVLGNPSRDDGTPGPEQRERVLKGVREWRKGVAPRLVMSGAAAHNRWVEGETMARLAVAQGVPSEDVIVEPQAKDTVQNVWYTVQMMQAHGWGSVEVVSSWYHLPRTERILAHFPIEWRTDAAPWPKEYGFGEKWKHCWHEVAISVELRRNGFKPSRFISR